MENVHADVRVWKVKGKHNSWFCYSSYFYNFLIRENAARHDLFLSLRFFCGLCNYRLTDDQCWAEINIQGMRLEGFVFTRTSASAPHICNVRCEQEIACQSYNYNRKEKVCELNNRAKEARPEGLRLDPAWFYIQRLNGRGMPSIEREIEREIFRGTIYHFIAHLGHISYKHPLRLLSKYILKKNTGLFGLHDPSFVLGLYV